LTDIAELPPGSTVDIHDHYAEKSAIWPKVILCGVFLAWIFALIWDVGILYTLTKDQAWGPLGKPPATQEEKQDKDTGGASNSTNAPGVKK
jgi:hypothetical protein